MKYSEFLEQLGRETGLRVSQSGKMLSGTRQGYGIVLLPWSGNNKYQFVISLSVCRGGQAPEEKELREVVKSSKQLLNCTVKNYAVNFSTRGAIRGAKALEGTQQALDAVLSFLRERGYENCCQSCGTVTDTAGHIVSGKVQLLCPDCGMNVEAAAEQAQQELAQTHESVIAGVVGALLGSLLGGVAIVLFSQLGYVSAFSGVIMAICTLKGYELLSKKASIKGIVISCVIMLVMTYVADRLDWAIIVAQAFEVDVFTAFRAVPALIAEDAIEASSYYSSLAMVYLFLLLGAVYQIVVYVKNMKAQNKVEKL